MMTLYGIKNCDTVKKARRWLEDQGIAYHFHDFRRDGLSAEMVSAWLASPGLETLLNKRGTTWRQLDVDIKAHVSKGGPEAITVLMEHPTLIKRPVLTIDGHTEVGFSAAAYQKLLGDK